MSSLENKVPPLLVLAVCCAIAWCAARWVPTPLDTHGLDAKMFAAVCALAGIGIAGLAVTSFISAGTTLTPLNPQETTHLVTSGVFGRTRNPMYVALLLLLLGWIFYLGSVTSIASAVIYIGYMTRFQILPEERILAKAFGKDYIAYCQKVRRWI